jgi:hypothetical protein
MRKAVNFRLNTQIRHILSTLEQHLCLSKTAIVEDAVQSYAKHMLQQYHPLLECVGSLENEDAKTMLNAIQSTKHNKELKLKL